MKKLRLSYSRASTFLNCRQAYRWAYIEGLVPKKKAAPLQVGDIVHQLFHLQFEGKLRGEDIQDLDGFVRRLYPENDSSSNLEVALQAASLFSGYLENYQNDPLLQSSSETHLEVEMPDFHLYGRIDGLCCTSDMRLWRLERKTSSSMDSSFLSGLKNSLQAGIYDYLLDTVLDEKHWGTIYDILVKTKVPQYKRNMVRRNLRVEERALKALEGVAQDIKRGDFYPSCNCFTYYRECDYLPLCNFDTPEVRESFFQTIPEKERR